MANTFVVTDAVAREVLRVMHEKGTFIATVDRQFDSSFKYDPSRGKTGQSLRVKSANQYKRRQGSRVMDLQDQPEVSQTITMATQDGVDMYVNSVELLQSLDNPDNFNRFSKEQIIPAAQGLISGIEADFLAYCTKLTYNVAGTAGTAISTLSVPGLARAKLNQQLAPKENRSVQFDSIGMASLVTGTAAYFAPNAAISDQYTEGLIKRTAMADYYENERVWTLPNSADVAGEINAGTLTSGITTLTVDGLTVAPVAGMVFTVGSGSGEVGIYDVHPETKVAYPHLKQFVCGAGCTTTSINFTPAMIYDTTNPRQNCSGTPADNADIAFVGSLSTNYVQPLMYQKEAYQFVTADLPLMPGECTRMTREGLSIRVWYAGDIINDRLLLRLDILYGMAALMPQWGCRMIGSANA